MIGLMWQVLIMYDVGDKRLSGIESTYVDGSACLRVKEGESDQFRMNGGGQECIMCGTMQW